MELTPGTDHVTDDPNWFRSLHVIKHALCRAISDEGPQ